MEEFGGVIILIILSIVSSLAKKAKRNNESKIARRIEGRRQQEMEIDAIQQKLAQEKEEAKRQAHRQAEKKEEDVWHQPAAPAYSASVPAAMNGEGIDSCHEYMLGDTAAAVSASAEEEEATRQQSAKELLRGVILSEILARPSQQRQLKRRGI